MKKLIFAFLFSLLLFAFFALFYSGYSQKTQDDETESYLAFVQDSMEGVYQNLDSYLASRELYNNRSVDSIEAYDNALVFYIKNERIVDVLNRTEPPEGFGVFHSLVVSSSTKFSSAYQSDMECIKTEDNASCEAAKKDILAGRDVFDEAIDELETLGVTVY